MMEDACDLEKMEKEIDEILKDENLIRIKQIYKRKNPGEKKLNNRFLYLAEKKDNNKEQYCIKVTDTNAHGSSNEESIHNLLNEINSDLVFKCKIIRKNIKKYYISKYHEFSLRKYIEEKKKSIGLKIDIEEIRHIMQNIVSGLGIFKELKIIHRDLKPENLLIDFKEKNNNKQDLLNSNIIIIDFGYSIINEDNDNYKIDKKKVGTPGYIHPKMGIYNLKQEIDIWSLGIICFELFKGSKPKFNNNKYIIPLKENTPLELVQLIDKLLQVNPKNQANLDKLSEDDFLNNRSSNMSFKEFLAQNKEKKIIITKDADGEEGIEFDCTSRFDFNYKKEEDNIDNLINECFVLLNENSLFNQPVIFPKIVALDSNE